MFLAVNNFYMPLIRRYNLKQVTRLMIYYESQGTQKNTNDVFNYLAQFLFHFLEF